MMASVLSQLQFSEIARPANTNVSDPKIRLRNKLIAALDMQIKFVEADLKGVAPEKTVTKYVGTGDDRKKVEEPGRVRRWYFQVAREWHTEVRYGTAALPVSGKLTVISAGSELKNLLAVYATLKEAVEKGELDKALAVAGVRRRKGQEQAAAPVEEKSVLKAVPKRVTR